MQVLVLLVLTFTLTIVNRDDVLLAEHHACDFLCRGSVVR
jgi:hypothetical protein